MVNTKYSFKVNKKSRSKRNLKDKYKRKTSINRKRNRQSKIRSSKKNKKGGMQEGEQITIQVRTNLDDNQEIFLEVNENEEIYDSICRGLLSHNIDCEKMSNVEIYLGGESLDKGDETFHEQGIEDGARLVVNMIPLRKRASVIQVLDDIIELNPESDDIEETKNYINSYSTVFIHPEEPWHFLNDLDLSYTGITQLPESIGDLIIDGDLDLNNNELRSLPESFGNLEIGKSLDLHNNNLTSLPDNFHEIKIDNGLRLDNNQITSLPKDFGKLSIGHDGVPGTGGLELSNNLLETLPEGLTEITVRNGDLYLRSNPLINLPQEEDFPNLEGSLRVVGSPRHELRR